MPRKSRLPPGAPVRLPSVPAGRFPAESLSGGGWGQSPGLERTRFGVDNEAAFDDGLGAGVTVEVGAGAAAPEADATAAPGTPARRIASGAPCAAKGVFPRPPRATNRKSNAAVRAAAASFIRDPPSCRAAFAPRLPVSGSSQDP